MTGTSATRPREDGLRLTGGGPPNAATRRPLLTSMVPDEFAKHTTLKVERLDSCDTVRWAVASCITLIVPHAAVGIYAGEVEGEGHDEQWYQGYDGGEEVYVVSKASWKGKDNARGGLQRQGCVPPRFVFVQRVQPQSRGLSESSGVS